MKIDKHKETYCDKGRIPYEPIIYLREDDSSEAQMEEDRERLELM